MTALATAVTAWRPARATRRATPRAPPSGPRWTPGRWSRRCSSAPPGASRLPGGQDFRDKSTPGRSPAAARSRRRSSRATTTDATFATTLVNRRGLDALEYLLFYEGADTACTGASAIVGLGRAGASGTPRKRAYAAAAPPEVRDARGDADTAWDREGASSTPATAGPGNAIFATTQAALNAVSDAIFYIETEVKDMKLARPLGLRDCATATCPELLESQFAGARRRTCAPTSRASGACSRAAARATRAGVRRSAVAVGAARLAARCAPRNGVAIRRRSTPSRSPTWRGADGRPASVRALRRGQGAHRPAQDRASSPCWTSSCRRRSKGTMTDAPRCALRAALAAPRDIAALAAFRIAFGADGRGLGAALPRLRLGRRVLRPARRSTSRTGASPGCRSLSAPGDARCCSSALAVLGAAGGAGPLLPGRRSSLLFVLFTYVQLVDVTQLPQPLLPGEPAGAAAVLHPGPPRRCRWTRWLRPVAAARRRCRRWCTYLLRFQVAVVYSSPGWPSSAATGCCTRSRSTSGCRRAPTCRCWGRCLAHPLGAVRRGLGGLPLRHHDRRSSCSWRRTRAVRLRRGAGLPRR